MDRTPATAHSGHDELLVARLFGGDVTEPERDRALDLMSECRECAALFADLDAIEEATSEMATPARPREFTLTSEDAVRLRPRRRVAGIGGWIGLRRAFGSSLAVLGILGVVATSVLSGTGISSGGSSFTSDTQRVAAQPALAAATAAPAGAGSADSAATTSPAPSMGAGVPNPGDRTTTDGTTSPVQLATAATAATPSAQELADPTSGNKSVPSTQPNPTATDVFVICCGQPSNGTNSSGDTNGAGTTPPSSPSSPGPDASLVLLAGFAAVFVAGLAVLIVPALRRIRSSRGASSR